MKILGDAIFARNEDGSLKSRIGTLFLKTPGLVTDLRVHALQCALWLNDLNETRQQKGLPPLTAAEEMEELNEAVDLIFTEDYVLIRPDPSRMDLAFRADAALQKLVSKRCIRFLNTHTATVRAALQMRGENWRMARMPLKSEEIDRHVTEARCAIAHAPVFYYNRLTSMHLITAGGYLEVAKLPPEEYRQQIEEIVHGLNTLNRFGRSAVALFPAEHTASVAAQFRSLEPENLDDAALREKVEALARAYRAVVPAKLRDESVTNVEWRNEMFHALSVGPNTTATEEQALVQGISPEFYRQIEWLPGARVERGRVVFDEIFTEAAQDTSPELLELCDSRVRNIIFNLMRLFGRVEYVNVGRIVRPLVRHPDGTRRGGVYIVQYKEEEASSARHYIIRFQKWGIAEHLDEGKELPVAAAEADQYADYILDRRLACRQLGMKLPTHVGFGQLTEPYVGNNVAPGTYVRVNYFVRTYIQGTASDKIPPARFNNRAFARRFAELMGEAAAIDLVVGRAVTETRKNVFDSNYEVLHIGEDGLPQDLTVTDHAGSFVLYTEPLVDLVPPYARVIQRRKTFVTDYDNFATKYKEAFIRRLGMMKAAYVANPRAYDELFAQRPFDLGGSMAYRWKCVLERLAAADLKAIAEVLDNALRA